MEVISKGKFIRLSPKKARSIAGLYRGQNAAAALVTLTQTPQKAAAEIAKVLKSAMANAENNFNLEKSELIVSSITIDKGPVLKRYRFRAKGATAPIQKPTAHITAIVSGEVAAKKEAEEGDKKEALRQAQDNTGVPGGAVASKADAKLEEKENKLEVERPEFIKKEQATPKVDVKSTFFRRKTG